MSSWKLAFPPSRTCLWDSTPTGEPRELAMTRDGWLLVQLSSSCLQLAFTYAKSHSSKTMDCFLIATSWINEAEGIILEVDRFDPGHPNKDRTAIAPTSVIPGDILVRAQVVHGSHPDAKYLTHNLTTLKDTLDEITKSLSQHHNHATILDPSSLLSLRIHCSCSQDDKATVQCGCVIPAMTFQATPITSIPIVSTALARNLSGPLPLSSLQGKGKYGYITMDTARRIVLLLHSDPIAASLPLIGVWVSGVSSVHHPLVWAACMTYTHSTTLKDRVWGSEGERTFITMVYCSGCTQPSFWECQAKASLVGDDQPPLIISTGEAEMQLPSEHSLVEIVLEPAQKSTAMHTLMETTLASSSFTPKTDSGAACISMSVSVSTTSFSSHTTSALTRPDRVTPHLSTPLSAIGEESLLADSSLPSCLPTPSQAPERITRDQNLSVLSSISVLSTHPDPISPEGELIREDDVVKESRRDQGSKLNIDRASQSAQTSALENSTHHKTTPTTMSSSIHMTLEDHQNQLKSLQEMLKCLCECQRTGLTAAVSTSPPPLSTPVAPTTDAATSIGASLYAPRPQPTFHTPAGGHSSKEDVSGDDGAVEVDTCSVQTGTSMMSHDATSMHLDLPSYFEVSCDSAGLGESASVSLPFSASDHHHQQHHDQLSPSSIQNWPDEQFLSDVMEKAHILENLDTSSYSLPESSPLAQFQGANIQEKQHSSQKIESGGRQGECDRQFLVDSKRNVAMNDNFCTNWSTSTNGSSSSSSQWRWREEGGSAGSGGEEDDDSDKTPTPPHESDSSGKMATPPRNLAPPLLNHPFYPHYPYDHLPRPPPFVTPLSAKTDHYPLHPEVLHQQLSPDVSMLPVPHILCPSSDRDTTVFGAIVENDYTLDENVYMADMIALKYLGMPGSSGNPSLGSNYMSIRGTSHRNKQSTISGDASNDKTLANMSMATQHYLQRYNLLAPGYGKRVGAFSPLMENQQEEARQEVKYDTLDIQSLKTLPKLESKQQQHQI